MKWKLIIILIFFSFCAQAQDANSIWQQANSAYKKGDYATAIEQYSSLPQYDKNFEVLANMGNTFYKRGELGNAILSYQKALALSPREEKLHQNLAYLQSKITTPVTTDTASLDNFLTKVNNLFSINLWTIFALLCLLFFIIYIVLAQIRQLKYWRRYALLLFTLTLVFAAGTYSSFKRQQPMLHAVTMVQMATLYQDAALAKPSNWNVPEGTTVKVLETKTKTLEVRLPNGLSGYVKAEDFSIY